MTPFSPCSSLQRTARLLRLLLLLLPLPMALAPEPASGQLVDRIRRRVNSDVERRIEERAVQAARRSLDLAEGAIVCAVTDKECIDEARKDGKEPVVVDADGKPVSGYEPPAPAADQPGTGVWANYDFVPGDDVLLWHDFEGTRTGNFPSRLEYVTGNIEVVELEENKALRTSGGTGCIEIPLPRALPERFTIEFRARTSDPQARAGWTLFSGATEPIAGCRYAPKPHAMLTGYQGAGLVWNEGQGTAPTSRDLVVDTWANVRIAADGPYWKMYVNERRVANVPRFAFAADSSLFLMFSVYGADNDIYVDDIRVAAGGPRSLYDDLIADGFFATTGILFETGSATLRPESTPTLEAVLEMLQEHDDLNLEIEGHTDNRGTDAANQTLSEQRAASVRQYLVGRGIDDGRLEAIGLGESQPAADNATAEGMASNRRVVFRRN